MTMTNQFSTAPLAGGQDSPTVMLELTIPNSPDLMEALGRMAIAYTLLELVLRYTVKTLSGLSIEEALEATSKERIAETRQRVRRLFVEKKPTAIETTKLDALLGKASRLTEKRNGYLHSAWSVSPAGRAIIKTEDHSWGTAPNKDEVEGVASELFELSKKINSARLDGFIHEVAQRQPLNARAAF